MILNLLVFSYFISRICYIKDKETPRSWGVMILSKERILRFLRNLELDKKDIEDAKNDLDFRFNDFDLSFKDYYRNRNMKG